MRYFSVNLDRFIHAFRAFPEELGRFTGSLNGGGLKLTLEIYEIAVYLRQDGLVIIKQSTGVLGI